MNLMNCFAPALPERLLQFERKLKTRLPEAYREFLLKHNGGELVDCVVMPDSTPIEYLYGLGVELDWCDLELAYEGEIAPGYLPIGMNQFNDQFLLSLDKATCGKIRLLRLPECELDDEPLATSFAAFVDAIVFDPFCDPDSDYNNWQTAIWQNDLPLLARILTSDIKEECLRFAAHKQRLDAMRMIVDSGVNIDAQDEGGNSALHLAAYAGSVDGVRYLAQHGASLELCNAKGRTPLVISIESAATRAALTLVELGADVTKRGISGKTIREICEDAEELSDNRYILSRILARG